MEEDQKHATHNSNASQHQDNTVILMLTSSDWLPD